MPVEYRLAGAAGCATLERGDLEHTGAGVLWIDALSPTDDELKQLDALVGFEVPNRQDITEIELSNRLYKEEGALVMIASLLPKSTGTVSPPRPAAFILRANALLTIRYGEFFSFERVAAKPFLEDDEQTPPSLFCRLLEEAVADRADNIEFSMRHMEMLTSRLFAPSTAGKYTSVEENVQLDQALRRIGLMGESISNIRESITSIQRVVNFAVTHIPESRMGEQKELLKSLASDLIALSDEASFFMNKLAFNLDATLGMINIDEAKVIRLLSVVTLLLSPPMLIAGIYGMNFNFMPELTWPFGYLFAVTLMIASALGSLWFLKRKRWL